MKRLSSILRRAAVPLLAVLTALLLGGVVIILTDFDNLQKIGTDPLGALGGAVQGVIAAYGAMLAGAFGDPGRIVTALQTGNPTDIARAVRPLTETLVSATPGTGWSMQVWKTESWIRVEFSSGADRVSVFCTWHDSAPRVDVGTY